MKLAILSVDPTLYSTRRLVAAAELRGHDVRVLETTAFSLHLEHGNPDIRYRGEELEAFDAVIPRIGASITNFGTAVLRQFEQMDVYSPNSASAILSSRHKLRALQVLSRHDIGIPPTAFVRRAKDVMPAIERVGGAPVVLKLLEGSQGVGVILADKAEIAAAIVHTLHSTKQNVLIQKFVAESRGKDVRAIVLGDEVVAAVRRTAQGAEFRSNVHLGGKAEAIELDERYRRAAVRAAQILGLRIAGVDMLESKDGPQVMEVNSSPGLHGVEGASGLDLAGAIVDFVAEQLRFPELDIRQRLTESPGYGVAELVVAEASSLANVSIASSRLPELGVHVLTLQRGDRAGEVLANPSGSTRVAVGDRLVCFGRLAVMKDLMPERRPRRQASLGRLESSE